MSWILLALLGAAVIVLVAAEWPRLERRFGARVRGTRPRRKPNLRVVPTERADSDDFAASVERDLARLPTIEEDRERRNRRG